MDRTRTDATDILARIPGGRRHDRHRGLRIRSGCSHGRAGAAANESSGVCRGSNFGTFRRDRDSGARGNRRAGRGRGRTNIHRTRGGRGDRAGRPSPAGLILHRTQGEP